MAERDIDKGSSFNQTAYSEVEKTSNTPHDTVEGSTIHAEPRNDIAIGSKSSNGEDVNISQKDQHEQDISDRNKESEFFYKQGVTCAQDIISSEETNENSLYQDLGVKESQKYENSTEKSGESENNTTAFAQKNELSVSELDADSKSQEQAGSKRASPEPVEPYTVTGTEKPADVQTSGDKGEAQPNEDSGGVKVEADQTQKENIIKRQVPISLEALTGDEPGIVKRDSPELNWQVETSHTTNKPSFIEPNNGVKDKSSTHISADKKDKDTDLPPLEPGHNLDEKTITEDTGKTKEVHDANAGNKDFSINIDKNIKLDEDKLTENTVNDSKDEISNVKLNDKLTTDETSAVDSCANDNNQDSNTVQQESVGIADKTETKIDDSDKDTKESPQIDTNYPDDFDEYDDETDLVGADKEGQETNNNPGDYPTEEGTSGKVDIESCPEKKVSSPARSTSLGSEGFEETLTTVIIDEDGIPQLTVTTVPDRPPSSQASVQDAEERSEELKEAASDNKNNSEADTNVDLEGENITDAPIECVIKTVNDVNNDNSTRSQEQTKNTNNKLPSAENNQEGNNNSDTLLIKSGPDQTNINLSKQTAETEGEITGKDKQSPAMTKASNNKQNILSSTVDKQKETTSESQFNYNSIGHENSNIDQQGDSVETVESSNVMSDRDSSESTNGGRVEESNKSPNNLNNEALTGSNTTSAGSDQLIIDKNSERVCGQHDGDNDGVNGEPVQRNSENSRDGDRFEPANKSLGKMDSKESKEPSTIEGQKADSGEDKQIPTNDDKQEEKKSEEVKVISPLEQLLQRNVAIDGSTEAIDKLETDVVKLLKSMKDVMKHYCEQLKMQSLKDFTEDLGKFRGDFESINDAFRRCSSMSSKVNTCLKELKVATDDVKMQINRKFQNEDLNTWIDQSPEQEKEKEKLHEESIAEEKVALARAAEAKHAVATAAVGISEAQKFVCEMEVQHTEAEATSKKATAQAKAAIIAAEEARVAAAERKRAEDAAKQRAEERARQKAEEEQKKRELEEIKIVQEAVRKGTDVEDEREHYMREKAKKEAERRNPRNWPKYNYKVQGKDFNPAVGCIIRAIDGSMRSNEVECAFVDQSEGGVVIRDNEELGSNIINIKQLDEEKKFIFEEPVSVALPVCFGRLAMGRDAVIKQQLTSGQWKDLPTSEVQFEDYRELKFLEGRCRGFGKFVVVLRLKKDSIQFVPKGNKAVSSVDSRITFYNKQGCFKHQTSAVIEVQPIDVYTISDLKTRAPVECEALLTSSPFIRMSISAKKFVKPLTITIPLPQAQTKQKRPTTSVGRKAEAPDARPQTARPSNTTDDEPSDDIHFLYKDERTGWTKNSKVRLIQPNNKDVVVFDLTEPFERFVLLRTKNSIKDSAIEKMAGLVEKSLTQRNVKVMLRQRNDDACDVIVACSVSNRLERVVRNLDEDGYTEGPAPSPDLVLREGEKLYMKFRGNLQCVSENPCLNFIFNSHIQTTRKFFVEEKDGFAQKSLPCYRGFVQVYTKRMVPRPPVEGASKNTPPTMVEAEVLLTELLIELPKPDAEPPKPLKTAPVPMKEGPLTSTVLHHVAREMGKEWRDVAAQLNLKPMRIQAILRQNVNKDTPQTRYDMLVTWAKRVPKSVDKVQILCGALQACGRSDLAEEIRYRGEEFKQQRLMSARVSHLRQAFVKVAKTVTIFNHWQKFAKDIGVPDEEIEKIDASEGSGQEKCFTSLECWKTVVGDQATVTELATHLKSMKQDRLSRDVESVLAS